MADKLSLENDEKEKLSCGPCNKWFSGPESLKAHLLSGSHQKKMKLLDTNHNLDAAAQPSTSFNLDSPWKCETCSKSFTGPENYTDHLNSKAHNRKLKALVCMDDILEKKDDFAQSQKELSLDGNYFCKDCKISCSGPESLKGHLLGSNHRKQLLKLQTLKDLEKMQHSLLDKTENIKCSSEDEKNLQFDSSFSKLNLDDNSGIFKCDVCHITVTGIIPFIQHIRGLEHAKKKKKNEIALSLIGAQDISHASEGDGDNQFSEILSSLEKLATNEETPSMEGNATDIKDTSFPIFLNEGSDDDSWPKMQSHGDTSYELTCKYCDIDAIKVDNVQEYISHFNDISHAKRVLFSEFTKEATGIYESWNDIPDDVILQYFKS